MSELSHFEAESAKTPKTQPYLILGGALFLCLVMWAISVFAPTDAVDKMKKGKQKQEVAAEVAPQPAMDDNEDDE